MKTSLARTNAVLSLEANENLTGAVGRFIVITSGKAALVTTTAQKPFGVLLTDGLAGERVTVALCSGGLAGTVRVKLAGTVSIIGSDIQTTAIGKVITDAGTGARVVVGQALETGVADELIEAVLFKPVTLA